MAFDPDEFLARTAPKSKSFDEGAFRNWYGGVSKKLGINPDPDDPEHHYDYRAFYQDVQAGRVKSPDHGGHFISAYKTAGHPREYLADSKGNVFSTVTGKYGDGTSVNDRELAKAEHAPDLPPERRPAKKPTGFDPDAFLAAHEPASPLDRSSMRKTAQQLAAEELAKPDEGEGPKADRTLENTRAAVVEAGRSIRNPFRSTPGSIAFDPASALSGAARKGYAIGRDLRAPGGVKAAGTGAVAGATLDFDDEAAGLISYLRATRRGEKGDPFAKTPEMREDVPAGPAASIEDYRKGRDERRAVKHAAEQAHPDSYSAGEFVGGAATAPLLPGAGSAKTAARALWQGAKTGAAVGALHGLGRSEADLTRGDVTGAAKDTLIGGATGAATGAATSATTIGTGKYVKEAPQRSIEAKSRALTEGADPTHGRRLVGAAGENAEAAVRFVEENPGLKKAVGNQRKVVEEADKIVDAASKEARPIYRRFDAAAGGVRARDVLAHIDDAISAETRPGGSSNVRDALRDLRRLVVEESGGPKKVDTANWSHDELRAWVTRRLKDKTRSMGSLSETEHYEVKDAVHKIADDFLKTRLRAEAAAHPELASHLERLSTLNRNMSLGIKVSQAAENAVARNYRVERGWRGDQGSAVVAGIVFGNGGPAALPAAAAAALMTRALPPVVKATRVNATHALAALATAVAGKKGPEAIARAAQAAINAGVPRAAVDRALRRAPEPAEEE